MPRFSISHLLNKMVFDCGVAITPNDNSDISGGPYFGLFVGVTVDPTVNITGGGGGRPRTGLFGLFVFKRST